MAEMEPDACRWYAEHLKPHEGMLRAWLSSRFGSVDEAEDIVQEALFRVLEARRNRDIRSPKAFLFTTARNVALMRLRKKEVRNEIALVDLNWMDIQDNDAIDISAALARNEELEMLTKAIQSLPTRCRQILTLRKIYGMSQKQIAKELNISVSTVESQGTIGLRKISQYFERHGSGT